MQKSFHGEAVTEISRGLSESDTPGLLFKMTAHPEKVQESYFGK